MGAPTPEVYVRAVTRERDWSRNHDFGAYPGADDPFLTRCVAAAG